jgi:tetratricopeptide (TPR) repeat protein
MSKGRGLEIAGLVIAILACVAAYLALILEDRRWPFSSSTATPLRPIESPTPTVNAATYESPGQPTATTPGETSPPSPPSTETCNASELFQRGWDLINRGTQNCSDAIESMSQAISCNPDNAEMWYGRGNVNFQCGAYINAVSDLTEAIDRNNANPLYYEMRGLAHMRIGDRSSYEACVQDFNRVLELLPNNEDALKNRDLCQQQLD